MSEESSREPTETVEHGVVEDLNLRGLWERFSAEPDGGRRFAALLGEIAPYTATVGAEVVSIGDAGSQVELPDRREVRNHLGCIHAIALTNLAEITGSLALGWQLPRGARFIVAKLAIEYRAKARGRITARGVCPPIASDARATYEVLVEMRNERGDVVATAMLEALVGPGRAAAGAVREQTQEQTT